MLSRRSVFTLLGLAALPVAAQVEAKPTPEKPKQTFLKGQVVPRIHEQVLPDYTAMIPPHTHSFSNAGHSHGYTPARVVREVEYQIFDGEKFVALGSEAGQRVIADLS